MAGRVAFTTENKGKQTDYDYPKLWLKKGEKARIIVGLEEPAMEWVHELRKPVILNGQAVLHQVTDDRTNTVTTEIKREFVSKTICVGDEDTVTEDGVDPRRCPMCKLAVDHPDWAAPPKRRFAMHVPRYQTAPNSFKPNSPFSVELRVWAFTDTVFNQIADAAEEHGDLRHKDFLLGPCTIENFQRFDINVGAEAEYLKNKDHTKFVIETFKNNRIKDITVAIGRRKQPTWIQADVAAVLDAWRIATRTNSSSSNTSLSEDLNGLMESDAPTDPADNAEDAWAPEGTEVPGEPDELDAMFSDLTSDGGSDEPDSEGADEDGADEDPLAGLTDAAEEPAPEPVKAPAARKPAARKPAATKAAPAPAAEEAVSPDNFDDLLGDMQ